MLVMLDTKIFICSQKSTSTVLHCTTVYIGAKVWSAMQMITVSYLVFNVPFQHKYGYMRDERSGVESYPYQV